MNLYKLHLAVPGTFGPTTRADLLHDTAASRSLIHIQLDGEVEDDLFEVTPAFCATRRLADRLICEGLTGFSIRGVTTSFDPEYEALIEGAAALPEIVELAISGRVEIGSKGVVAFWSGDDFCRANTGYLVVSERSLDTLREQRMPGMVIQPLKAHE